MAQSELAMAAAPATSAEVRPIPERMGICTHLLAALLALGLGTLAIAVGVVYARQIEARYMPALAPELFDLKLQGTAVQVEAFKHPDLLPMYGSSEFDSFVGPFHGQELFRDYPTGFEISPVGRRGMTALVILQSLAAVGPDLRGKKVVICVSPTFFFHSNDVRREYYTGNYSRLHAGQTIFGGALSFDLKRQVASRMTRYSETLTKDPILRVAVEALDDDSSQMLPLYFLSWPLGRLQNGIWELQDHWETLRYIRGRTDLDPNVVRRPNGLDWGSVLARAERESERRANNNPLGFDNEFWGRYSATLTAAKGRGDDGAFQRSVREGYWIEFELLLRSVRELGAEPLLLSVPMKGPYYDYWGISARARLDYYRKVRTLARNAGIPLVDFQEFDADKYFLADDRSHPSQKGWAYYAQAVDEFYHGKKFELLPIDPRPR